VLSQDFFSGRQQMGEAVGKSGESVAANLGVFGNSVKSNPSKNVI
jgi:hypothetical protein